MKVYAGDCAEIRGGRVVHLRPRHQHPDFDHPPHFGAVGVVQRVRGHPAARLVASASPPQPRSRSHPHPVAHTSNSRARRSRTLRRERWSLHEFRCTPLSHAPYIPIRPPPCTPPASVRCVYYCTTLSPAVVSVCMRPGWCKDVDEGLLATHTAPSGRILGASEY